MAFIPAEDYERRVLLAAPTTRDAQITQALLAKAGLSCFICENVHQISTQFAAGAGAILLTEEVISDRDISELIAILDDQPDWSDIPIVMLMHGGAQSPIAARVLSSLKNVTVLERPASTRSVVSVVSAAVRGRERQYQMRKGNQERDEILERERTARAEAEQANRSKDEFLATLSHELRTPLTPILAASQILEKRSDMLPALLDYVSVIKRNAVLEARLIDDLLDLNRIVHGKVALAKTFVSLHHAIRSAVEICKAPAEDKRIAIELLLIAQNDEIHADPARIQQIIWNLLSNAIKFTPPGGRITIRTENDTEAVEVCVSDNGKGIEARLLETIFDAFEQGDTRATENMGGLGLGLAICKTLVALHNGAISAKSEGLGKGSSFVVRLPLAQSVPDVADKQETPQEKKPVGGRILLVEDHMDTAQMMKQILELNGLQVVLAEDVASAIALTRREKFDLMLCDLGLPDGSGLEVMQTIGRENIRGVALTGRGMESDVKACFEAGFIDHLTKPVDIDRLERVVKQLLA